MTSTSRVWPFLILLTGLITVSPFDIAGPKTVWAASIPVERLELLKFLRSKQFRTLEDRLSQIADRYRAGIYSDQVVDYAYGSFASADPDLEDKLAAWIARYPNSASARMARGMFRLNLAWIARNYALARNTPETRFKNMRYHLDRARPDFMAALRLDPQAGLAYGSLIQMAKMIGQDTVVDELMHKGLAADPRSFVIRSRYLSALLPWWRTYPLRVRSSRTWAVARLDRVLRNGSSAYRWFRRYVGPPALARVPLAIRQFVARIDRDARENPALAPLRGYADYVAAEILQRDNQKRAAVEHYERALRFGEYPVYQYAQGRNYYRLGRYRDAADSYTQALAIRPQASGTLNERARSFRKLEQSGPAFADWANALSVSPKDPAILVQVAYALRESGRYAEALATLDSAMLYGANDDDVRDARGRLLLYELERPADALADLKRATELDPKRKKYWFNYASALLRVKNCDAADALEKYHRLCKAGAKCSKKNVQWAEETIAHLRVPGFCEAHSARLREAGPERNK